MASGETKRQIKGSEKLCNTNGRHVYAESIQPLPEDLKKKITSVLCVIPRKSKTDIAEALQRCDYNVERVLNTFISEREMESQSEWKVQGRKNKNRKKSGKKPNKDVTSTQNGDQKMKQKSAEKTAVKVEEVKTVRSQATNGDDCTSVKEKPPVMEESSGEKNGENTPMKSVASSTQASTSETSKKQKDINSATQNKNTRIRTHSASGSDIIKKSLKDLQRSSVSISRFQSTLDEDAENSLKLLSKSFQALRQTLDERERLLEEQLNTVITESKKLLQERQEDAAGLKFRCNSVSTMSEEATNELRNEIKHFVGERRIDEELGKTKRFLRDEDKLTEAIKTFGEIIPIKHHYTAYIRKYNAEVVKTKASDDKPASVSPITMVTEKKEETGDQKGKHSRNPVILSPSRLKDQAEMYAKLKAAVEKQKVTNDQISDEKKTAQKGSTPPSSNNDNKSLANEARKQNGRQGNRSAQQRSPKNDAHNTKNGDVAGGNGGEVSSDAQKQGTNHVGPRRTRRHYIRKEPNNPISITSPVLDRKEPGTNFKMTNGHDPLTGRKDHFVHGKNGYIGLPQRNPKQRRIYKKNPDSEIKFPPPPDNASSGDVQPVVA